MAWPGLSARYVRPWAIVRSVWKGAPWSVSEVPAFCLPYFPTVDSVLGCYWSKLRKSLLSASIFGAGAL